MGPRPENKGKLVSVKEFRLNRKTIGAHSLVALWGPGPTGNAPGTWFDMAVRKNDGVMTNMVPATDWVVDPERGWVLEFLDLGESVQVPNFLTTGDYSITAWVKASSWVPGGINVAMAIIDNAIASGSGFRFYAMGDAGLWLKLTNGYLIFAAGAVGTVPLVADVWWHLAGTSHNTGALATCHVYQNGRLTGSNVTVDDYVQNGSNVAIGYRPIGSDSAISQFTGRMHDVRFYNRVLTGAQITHMYNATRYHPYADILLRPTRRYVHRHRGALEAD